jgi:hypothetical protein
MSDLKKVWNDEGNRLYLSFPSKEFDNLDKGAIYTVNVDEFGRFYLTKKSEGYKFDYKLYGLESKFINRVLKTYSKTNGNLGILLNGIKGTGKTVSSKLIASEINQPIILIDRKLDGVHTFLNTITQDITIFIDEYEKVYGDSAQMLTIMDGALNSTFRRMFLMTTNDLYVDRNLIERPSRVRYLKMFGNLKPEVVEEVIDDILEYPEMKKECIYFISSLETITIDIVKAVINEVNIHEEAPSAFEDVFNVKKIKGNYNVKLVEDGKLSELAKNVRIYPRPTYNDGTIGYRFEIDGQTIGHVSRIVNWTTIEVSPYVDDKGKKVGFDEPIIIKIEDADAVNYSYTYGSYDEYGMPTNDFATNNSKEISDKAKSIIKALEDEEEEADEDIVSLKAAVDVLKSSTPLESWDEEPSVSEG